MATSTDELAEQDFKLALANKIFLLKAEECPSVDKTALQKDVLNDVMKHDLLPIYDHCCAELGWTVDQAVRAAMKAKNDAKMEELESKIKDAEENLGEQEVRDALLAKADYLASVGDKDAATAAFDAAEAKTTGFGNKMDLVFSQIRLLMFYEDWREVNKLLAKAQTLCDQGGDWERKNKLKVYEAVYAMHTRNFKQASSLFLEALATFTATELFPYSRVIFYAVVTAVVAMDRVSLKKSVIDASEVLTGIGQIPHLEAYLNSLYACKYASFFAAFVEVVDLMRADPYLSLHLRYYMREVRVVAYAQFLESYKSVTLESMAAAFDVPPGFLDAEVADFIVAGRLNAKIDKVAGIVETNRPDQKNSLYQDTIRKGDVLLNRIQKLSKVVDVE
uniref:26S proteasome regulatory subunit RPN7 n=1 Tax=Chlamydomonas euryale TaxID=1486919 RepID=A0A7R9UZ32_9CHLO